MIHADGFVIGPNPSKIGGGYTLVDGKGNLIHRREIKYLEVFTNNDGELRGLVHAIIIAKHYDVVVTDSRTVYWWVMKGRAKARPDLNEICKIGNQAMHLKKVEVRWVPREQNLAGIYNDEYAKRKKRERREKTRVL